MTSRESKIALDTEKGGKSRNGDGIVSPRLRNSGLSSHIHLGEAGVNKLGSDINKEGAAAAGDGRDDSCACPRSIRGDLLGRALTFMI